MNTGGTGEINTSNIAGDQIAGHFEDDGRRDRRLRGGSVGETNGEDGKVEKHLQGKHDQKTHGGGRGSSSTNRPGMGDGINISDENFNEMYAASGGPRITERGSNKIPIFTVERQALHDRIVSDAVDQISPVDNPTYTIKGWGSGFR